MVYLTLSVTSTLAVYLRATLWAFPEGLHLGWHQPYLQKLDVCDSDKHSILLTYIITYGVKNIIA